VTFFQKKLQSMGTSSHVDVCDLELSFGSIGRQDRVAEFTRVLEVGHRCAPALVVMLTSMTELLVCASAGFTRNLLAREHVHCFVVVGIV
jgi:hypothetical protein